ncbi:MAG: hypothetical protein D0531_01305 [Methylococcales bacterium]|nr:MAG: hypothetical protein D0531_01305 [Methylococcales bacterium]
MAEVQKADVSIYNNLNTQKPMSLADMLNIGKSSYELSKLKELYPAMISGEQARSKAAEIGASQAEQLLDPNVAKGKAESKKAIVDLNETELKNLTAHSNATISGIQKLFNKQDLTAQDVVREATELNRIHGGSPQALEKTLQGIPNGGSQTDLKAWLAQQLATTTGSLSQLEKQYPSGILPGQLPQTQTPQVQETKTPQAPGVTPQAMNLPDFSQPVKTPYPMRNPNSPYLPMPSEEADKVSGINYRDNLVSRQSQLTTEKRNVEEVIKEAKKLKESIFPTSGIAGAITRKVSTWAGDPTYIQLSKDLANTTLSNMKALGLKTDADKQLSSAANGDYTYPPEILLNIADRAQADMKNIDMQATGAQKFTDRFGDNNMKKFQQEWSKNADSKIFQIMNLAEDGSMPTQDKQKEIAKLLGPVGSKERKTAEQKYRNLIKLQQTGSLE